MSAPARDDIASRLIAAYDGATMLAPISEGDPQFDVPRAYEVLAEIERRRVAQGWRPVGRKIGFTNVTIWERYGVHQPMWAHTFAHTVHFAPQAKAALSLAGFVQPRIEPEVVFKLKAPVTDDAPESLIRAIDWIAPGFEIVQSHFPNWKFTAADCTAAFGLHGALVVGPPLAIDERNRDAIVAALPTFTLTLSRGAEVIDTGVGANVLGGPMLALAHLVRVLRGQPHAPALTAGEVITTGTITDAWPVKAGETWSSDYGAMALPGLTLSFT